MLYEALSIKEFRPVYPKRVCGIVRWAEIFGNPAPCKDNRSDLNGGG